MHLPLSNESLPLTENSLSPDTSTLHECKDRMIVVSCTLSFQCTPRHPWALMQSSLVFVHLRYSADCNDHQRSNRGFQAFDSTDPSIAGARYAQSPLGRGSCYVPLLHATKPIRFAISAFRIGQNGRSTEEGAHLCEMLGDGLAKTHRHDHQSGRESGQGVLHRTATRQNGARMETHPIRSSPVQTNGHVHHQGIRGNLPDARRSYRRNTVNVVLPVQESIRRTHCFVGKQTEDHSGSARRVARLSTFMAGQ